ncbi:MAG: MMPL family transporter [Mycobacteriales bacterium]
MRTSRVWPRALLAALVFILVAGGVFGPLSGKLADEEKNTNASFLSKTAESTRTLRAAEAFIPENNVPTVILYERSAGTTKADVARAVDDLTQIRKHRSWLDGDPTPPIPAQDGKALQVVVPFDGQDGKAFAANIKAMREELQRPGKPSGLDVYVTGLGGTQADLFEVFDSISGTLLLVTLVIVIVILLLVYRSPILWLLPVIGSGIAYTVATGILYLLAKHGTLTVNGQSTGILPVLTFGAATDYALLLIARYREELHRHGTPWDAMKVAWRAAAPAIVASGATVIVSLLCLLFSELEGNKGLGPVAAIGIACAVVTQLVLLPALLLLGRWLFWPRIPQLDGQDPVHEGFWSHLADRVGTHTATIGAGTLVALVLLALGVAQLNSGGIPQDQALTSRPESVIGQEHLARHFAAGAGTPIQVVAPVGVADQVRRIAAGEKDIAAVTAFSGGAVSNGTPLVRNGKVLIEATLSIESTSPRARDVVRELRKDLDGVSQQAIVGGFSAIELDIHTASKRDNRVIIPTVLVLIFLVLALLLRALVAPLLLIGTVVLSYLSTLGACALVFNHVFDYPGADASFPLFVFVFLVALGVDYNIFLMTRVREDAAGRGTREAMLRGLTVTGGVITSAGVVLAATFAALATLPLVFLSEIGFAVAFGVLLDTLVVRSLLVPTLVLTLDDKVWWPVRS